MPNSIADERAWEAARSLMQDPPASLEVLFGGGNNRLYRVIDTLGRMFALKSYPTQASDPRDRLGTEFAALDFLSHQNVPMVPQALACDPKSGFALYEWVEGGPVTHVEDSDIDKALEFAHLLKRLQTSFGAKDLPLASEACLSPADIAGQIHKRHIRLADIANTNPVLANFLNHQIAPVLQRALTIATQTYARRGWPFDIPIPRSFQTLSPSDFGYHNAIRRPNGDLAFIDFEYFGWDDPVKLVADFLLHPAMNLTHHQRMRFKTGALQCYADDAGFPQRLTVLYPLIGLRWCMILLNEFLPERWFRRQFSGAHTDQEQATQQQLEKARLKLAVVSDYLQELDK